MTLDTVPTGSDPVGTIDCPEPRDNLADVQVVFADCRAALDYAYSVGLNKNATVRTMSPSLVLDSSLCAEPADTNVAPEAIRSLGPATLAASTAIFHNLRSTPELAESAVAVAQIVLSFGYYVRMAMALTESDYQKSVAVVQGDFESPEMNKIFNAPWHDALASNPSLRLVVAPRHLMPAISRRPPESTSFRDRQVFGGWEKVGFQLLQSFWRRAPISSPRGTFLLMRENLLLRETALYLAGKGFSLHSISPPSPGVTALDEETLPKLQLCVVLAMEILGFGDIAAPARTWLTQKLTNLAMVAVLQYRSAKTYWRDTLSDLSSLRPKAVLTNVLITPAMSALHRACREHDLPMVTFQHGVTREIGVYSQHIKIGFEGNSSDIFYTFNPAAARRSEDSEFNVAQSIPVGLPASYWRCGNYRKGDQSAPPIIFASTQLYAGTVNMAASRGTNDLTMAKNEIRLIDEVLSQLPHRVLFKPYPDARFPDPDPVLARVENAPNMTIYPAGDDLSFLLPDCRLTISSRATSTISWCAMSGKPFLYIDHPHENPLHDSARAAFAEAFFLFDGGSPTFYEDLREFLSRPLEEIEADWMDRATARPDVIAEYFGHIGPGAGQRAGQDLLNRLQHHV